MSKGRDIAADKLSDVLELARLRRESGLLSVEHAQGGRVEEGEIYFQDGEPVYARVGRLVGQDALAWLIRWQRVYLAFLTDVPSPPANIPVSTANNGNSTTAVSQTDTAPMRAVRNHPASNGSSAGVVPAAALPSSLASYIRFESGVATDPSIETARNHAIGSSRANGYVSNIEWLIPQKLDNERDVLSLPLTRPQRCIYFLVNGQRTVADLSRTTNKNLQEVERILSELQEQGLIAV